jgi:peptidoglycan/LPS O-acetylase OafA/YrhL
MRKLQLSPTGQAKVLWGICALVLLWRCYLVFAWHVPSDRTYMGTDTRFDSIMFGCALAVWNNPALDALKLNERRWKYAIVPGAVAVILGCLLYRAPSFRESLRYSLQGLALTVIFVAAIRFKDWLPFRFLNWRPVAFIGVLSYSLYLLHLAVVFAVERNLPRTSPALQGALALGIAFLLAWGMYVLVEKPAARYRRRLTD